MSDSLLSKICSRLGIVKAKEDKEEEMISYEVVYEPNTKDAHNQWMSEDTIRKGCENFNANLAKGVVKPNLFHMKDTDQFEIVKTWINEELDVKVQGTEEAISKGSWVAMIKYNDSNLWELRKANIVQGVSIGCLGTVNDETGEITNLSFDGE